MTDVETDNPSELVAALADAALRNAAFQALVALGPSARDAVRAGLGDGRWEVRRWCTYWLMRFADASDFEAIAPLVRDPKSAVRQIALVALAHGAGLREHAEVTPLLLERACNDESLRVRRSALSMLVWDRAHPDLEGFLRGLLETERDEKLCLYARIGIARGARRVEGAPC